MCCCELWRYRFTTVSQPALAITCKDLYMKEIAVYLQSGPGQQNVVFKVRILHIMRMYRLYGLEQPRIGSRLI